MRDVAYARHAIAPRQADVADRVPGTADFHPYMVRHVVSSVDGAQGDVKHSSCYTFDYSEDWIFVQTMSVDANDITHVPSVSRFGASTP